MPSLAVFDIDGTLIDNVAMDTDACFFPALKAEFGIEGGRQDWTLYAEPTSAGCLDEIFRTVHGRPPTQEEIVRAADRLDDLMRERYLDGRRIPPMRGALDLLRRLSSDGTWRLAIATGNWHREAAIKIESAGLPAGYLPIATATDRPARRDILRVAVERATKQYAVPAWDRVVYLGDGVWDVRAARANGLPFVGVGSGERAARLTAEGATTVTPDLADPARMLDLLNAATPPRPANPAPAV